MKKKAMFDANLEARFSQEKMDDSKLNYLKGGDGDGSQPGIPEWPKI